MNKILLVGATGYVGGTVLTQLLSSTSPALQSQVFDVVVRKPEQVQKLQEEYGDRVRAFQWLGLDDTAFIERLAGDYDIIVNTGTGFHAAAAIAFVQGQAHRITAGSLHTPWYINLSGCTNLATLPFSQPPVPIRRWDDLEDGAAIFEQLKKLESQDSYPQRKAELGVLELGERTGVQAVSVNVPVVFGEGEGLFNKQGTIIPRVMNYALQHGYGFKLNETANFDRVHVADCAKIFELLVRAILERPDRGIGFIPVNEKGVIFAEAGHITIRELNQCCLDLLFEEGLLPKEGGPLKKEIRLCSVQELADKIALGRTSIAERSWAGYKFTNSSVARKVLGWKPTRLDEAWRQDFKDELAAMKEGRRIFTFAGVIGAETK
ncbi:NAD dependent epimerase/dehydratase family protein-like protein [Massarina eburnea CBS 473.64]|uniref:NAD dependent epimerase/dehydratase family protein-like protein n=1 Tax=Massarina eburnea CBS 473.64 TaxID=1395130 RepID=A0A6A6RVG4_9PLEO|nr:NAD dependent epimerase/dehydratase family protein-like protein [Massarina eburnea CBS 473.64]